MSSSADQRGIQGRASRASGGAGSATLPGWAFRAGPGADVLAEASADPGMRDALTRLGRLGRGGLGVWSAEGRLLFSTVAGARAEVPDERVVLGVGSTELGWVGPIGSVDPDALEAAARLLDERLIAETEKNALTGEILDRLQELAVLNGLAGRLAEARELPEVARTVLDEVCGLVGAEWAGFLGYDADRSEVRLVSMTPRVDGVPRYWQSLDPSSWAWEALNAEGPLLVASLGEAARDRLRREVGAPADRARCLLAVPMSSPEGPVGALVLLKGVDQQVFTSMEAKLVAAIASQAALSVSHLQLFHDSREMFHSTVWALASAIDAKDAYTHGHSQRVARFAATLARSIGFDDLEIERLELAAVLHDIGKIGVPEVILNKVERLSAAEMALMRGHPEKGAEILSSIRALRDIVPGVLHHHERWDGRGYPDGLRGENIPLQARIILIADTFDAMTSTRPYRAGLPPSVALDELVQCSGTQFDRRLVEHFVDLHGRGHLRVDAESRHDRDVAADEGGEGDA